MTPYKNLPNVFSDTVQAPNGSLMNVLVYLPADYKTKIYPVFWFWNGMGEDSGGIDALKVWGPFSFISASFQPNCIVVAVQGLEWANLDQTDFVFARLKTAYNFGAVIASGLSAGGYGVTKLMSYYPGSVASKSVVAIIPMSTSEGFGTTAVLPTIKSNIPVWGFGDDPGDVHGVNTHNFITALQKGNTKGNYKWTNTNPDGHGGWNKHYDPTYKENGLNIYDWGMQFVGAVTTIPPVVIPPIVIPPSKTIKSILITYSDGSTLILP